uniref:Trans-1,2-dihydrobenzene-1,2-diol dehydrogenase n=1 Tax=Bursaphelenchus xylophilus TaxID=6326 RepID=A0A1I7SRE4_BURXY
MAETTLKWGILGCGNICNDFVMALDKTERKHKVVAIGASSLQRAEEFYKSHSLDAKVYGDYESVLADKNVDVIYIGLRNYLHHDHVIKALKAGKNVLCEKPLGLNLKQTQNMIETAKSAGKLLVEGYWSLHFPAYRKLDSILAKKEYGKAYKVEASFGYTLPSDFVNLERGETMLTTLGCYTIMVAHFVYKTKGEVFKVDWAVNEKGGDKRTKLTLNFGEGKQAVLTFDETQSLENKLKVHCERGVIEIDQPFWCPTLLTTITGEGSQNYEFPLNDDRKFNYPNSSGLRYEIDHIYDTIVRKKTQSEIGGLKKAPSELVLVLSKVSCKQVELTKPTVLL